MFVPDEEAARGIEAWGRAVAAIRTGGLWPGWPPSAGAFGLALPGGAGLCVTGAADVQGRPVAARSGGALSDVRHLSADDLRAMGVAGLDDEAAATLTLAGERVHIVGSAGGAAVMASNLARVAFDGWWSARGANESEPDGPPPPAPDTSPERAALAAVEARLLERALAGGDLRTLALQIALVRRERWAATEDEEVLAEERWEVEQGMPAYVGGKAAAALGLDGLAELRDALPDLGRVPAGRRARLSGWALAELLDRLEAQAPPPPPGRARSWAESVHLPQGWKAALQEGKTGGLQPLLDRHVPFDGGSRDDAALKRALETARHAEVLQVERARASEAADARRALVDEILRGSGTLMVFDVRELGPARVEAAAPAQAIHAGMAVYPEGASFHYADGTWLRFHRLALVEDRRSGLIQSRVHAHLRWEGDGTEVGPDEEALFEEGLHLRLPGLDVHARTGVIRPIDGGYLIRMLG